MASQQKRLNRTQSTALIDWLRNNVGLLDQHNVPALTDMASVALGFPISVNSLPYSAKSVGLRVGLPKPIRVVKLETKSSETEAALKTILAAQADRIDQLRYELNKVKHLAIGTACAVFKHSQNHAEIMRDNLNESFK